MEGHKLFIGYEAEGPERGVLTLFVPSGVPAIEPRRISSVLKENRQIRRVYFGAGNETGLNPAHADLALSLLKLSYSLVIEIIDLVEIEHAHETIKKNAYIVHTIRTDSMSIQEVYVNAVKYVGEYDLHWFEIVRQTMYHTELDDRIYNADEEV